MFLHSFTKNCQISTWCLTVICSSYHLPRMPEIYSHSMSQRGPQTFSNHIICASNVHMPGWCGFVFRSYEQFPKVWELLMCHIIVLPIPRSASLEYSTLFTLLVPLFSLVSLFLLDSFRFLKHGRMLGNLRKQKKWLPPYIFL